MMGGPAALAVQTGAALMPAILWFEGDGWGVQIPACRTKLPPRGLSARHEPLLAVPARAITAPVINIWAICARRPT